MNIVFECAQQLDVKREPRPCLQSLDGDRFIDRAYKSRKPAWVTAQSSMANEKEECLPLKTHNLLAVADASPLESKLRLESGH
ncbi:MAG: hypothetical protein CMJ78_10650 [Planctomycetaceae bacterium]|nr:hypothetical protein [Planctomycetaceae bacterium]